jgi:hypothetical protein
LFSVTPFLPYGPLTSLHQVFSASSCAQMMELYRQENLYVWLMNLLSLFEKMKAIADELTSIGSAVPDEDLFS